MCAATTLVVNIDDDETVDDLGDAIKEEQRLKSDDIPASSLYLWKASVPYKSKPQKRSRGTQSISP